MWTLRTIGDSVLSKDNVRDQLSDSNLVQELNIEYDIILNVNIIGNIS